MFDNVRRCAFLVNVTLKVALRSGSSKQGKAFLACVVSNCVVAMYLEYIQAYPYVRSKRICKTEEQMLDSFYFINLFKALFPIYLWYTDSNVDV